MTDEFDAAVASALGQQTIQSTTTDPFDAAVASVLAPDKGRAARAGFALASSTDPDAYSEAQRIARRAGLPISTVLNRPAESKRLAAIGTIDFETLGKTSPATAALLADIEKAKVSHDDIESLRGIEGLFAGIRDSAKYVFSHPSADHTLVRDLGAGVYRASSGLAGVAMAGLDTVGATVDPLVGGLLPANPAREASAFFRGIGDDAEAIATRLSPPDPSRSQTATGVSAGIQSMAQNIALMPMLLAGPNAYLAAMSSGVGGNAYRQARDQGMSLLPSLTFGATQGAIEFATERLPLHLLLKDLKAGTGLLKTMARQTAVEVPQEQLAELLQDLNEWAVLPENRAKTARDFLKERPEAAYQTLIATIVGSAGQTAIMHGVYRVTATSAQREQDAALAFERAQVLEGLNRMAAASKLAQRDPDTFQAFVEQASADGPFEHVYIEADVLMQSGLADELMQASPAVAEQFAQAAQAGGMVSIPVAEYAARIAPKEAANQLLDHLKTDPEGFSRAEAQEWTQGQQAEMQAEFERVAAQQESDSQFAASAESVRDIVKTQLDQAGRFTEDVNSTYATLVSQWYAVQAARTNITPQELYQRYPLTVQGQSVLDGQVYGQDGRLKTDTKAFRNWFGDSKVVDSDDKPLVVYHGTRQDFTEFDTVGGNTSGSWFTTNKSDSEAFGSPMPVYLAVRNPASLTDFAAARRAVAQQLDPAEHGRQFNEAVIRTLEKQGFDGLHALNFKGAGGQEVWMAFRPEQIKSATGNRGTFDATDPNILHQEASQNVPIVALTGAEISADLTPDNVVPMVREWFKINLQGAAITREGFGEVRVSGKTWGKVKNGLRVDLDKARLIPAIPEIIRKGAYEGRFGLDEQRKDKIVAFHFFRGSVNLDGAVHDVGVTVGEDAQGNLVYNLNRNPDALLARKKGPELTQEVTRGTKPSEKSVLPRESPGSDVLNQSLNQPSDGINLYILNQLPGGSRGTFSPSTLTISLLKNADLSTFLHETGHFFLEVQADLAGLPDAPEAIRQDMQTVLDWFGVPDLATWQAMDLEQKRIHHEKFARGFEAYLFEGKSPSIEMQGLFQRFRAWLVNVYKSLKNLNVKLSDEVRGVVDRMLASGEQIELAEWGRSMMPLFEAAEQAGMTQEEFAAYQALSMQATADAIQDLQTRGLRDMKWLHNARSKALKNLQAQADARRTEMRIEARREIMSHPYIGLGSS